VAGFGGRFSDEIGNGDFVAVDGEAHRGDGGYQSYDEQN